MTPRLKLMIRILYKSFYNRALLPIGWRWRVMSFLFDYDSYILCCHRYFAQHLPRYFFCCDCSSFPCASTVVRNLTLYRATVTKPSVTPPISIQLRIARPISPYHLGWLFTIFIYVCHRSTSLR